MKEGENPTLDATPGGISAELRRAAPYLSELSEAEMSGLSDLISVASLAEGDVVISEGSPGDSLFIVCRGTLTVTTRGAGGMQVPVGTLQEGDFFGEISILLGRPRSATVVAASDGLCLKIEKETWDRLERRLPRLRRLLEEAIQARATRSAEALVDDLRRHHRPGGTEAG